MIQNIIFLIFNVNAFQCYGSPTQSLMLIKLRA